MVKLATLLLSTALCWGQSDLARQPFMCGGIKTRYLFTPPDLLQRKVPSKWIGFCFTDGGVTTGCTELDLPSLDCIHVAGWSQRDKGYVNSMLVYANLFDAGWERQPFGFYPAYARLFTRQPLLESVFQDGRGKRDPARLPGDSVVK